MMTAKDSRDWEIRKRQLVIETGKTTGFKTLIETGTAHGAMVEACIPYFNLIHSIELQPNFFFECRNRFLNEPNVKIYFGDSATILPKLLQEIPNSPAIYWLDAHCSGGDTAGDPNNPPLEAEIAAVLKYRTRGIILIDDQHLTDDELALNQRMYPGYQYEDHIGRIDVERVGRV